MLSYLRSTDERLLPLITIHHLLLGLIVMIAVKMAVRKLLKGRTVQTIDEERTSAELENHYYYHLGTVLVLVATVSWNAYDFYIWLVSYVGMGILRKAVAELLSSQNTFLESLGFDNRIKSLLQFSRRVGLVLTVFSLCYSGLALILFCHSKVPVLCVLLYPTLRLAVDSLYLLLKTITILKHLPCFYNNNIDGVSPAAYYGFFHNALSGLLKVLHFGKLLQMVPAPSQDFFFVVYAPWVLLLGWELLQGLKQIAREMARYYEFKWLVRRTDEGFPKKLLSHSEICAICREELITTRRIECGHLFHFKCIFRWLVNSADNQCPICRSEVLRNKNRHRCSLSKQHY